MAEVPEAAANTSTQSVLSKQAQTKRNTYSREEKLNALIFSSGRVRINRESNLFTTFLFLHV
jgi:hypothetical protein